MKFMLSLSLFCVRRKVADYESELEIHTEQFWLNARNPAKHERERNENEIQTTLMDIASFYWSLDKANRCEIL